MQKSDLHKFNLPDVPGVYLFKKGREVLYVGKATSLRDRVRSYFDDDLIATRGPRIVDMVTAADRVAYEPMPTVLEALVREAALIKQYQPRANVDGKDDKTFLYAVITKEEWPRVLTVRGKDLKVVRSNLATYQVAKVFGPFPSGPQLREALRIIRKIFPFYDTPRPIISKHVGRATSHMRARIEFNRQIGQYPNVSFEASAKKEELDKKKYRHTIRNVAMLLGGRAKALRKVLAQEMKQAAKEERFEDAAAARRQLFALDHIQDVSLIKDENRYPYDWPTVKDGEIRIEAYDTAHLAGTNAIGVMTVLIDGVPSKKEYRTFRIRGFKKNDDVGSLKEILSRRLNHPEWSLPDAIVVDGGKPQKKAAEEVLKEAGFDIPVAAVVKDERHRPREVIGARAAGISEADAVLVNAEAHRFSLSRHRAARSQQMRSK